MTDNAVIAGEYVTFKHVKTRKVVVLEVEVPEELFQDVITKLGMPIGGESKPVAVCLLNSKIINKEYLPNGTDAAKELGMDGPITQFTVTKREEKSEGEKLRIRAVMLCKEESFHRFVAQSGFELLADTTEEDNEIICKEYILVSCGINSRAELTKDKRAQSHFRILDEAYKEWCKPSVEEQYSYFEQYV